MTIESNRVRAQQHDLCVRARAAERASCHRSRPARHLGRLDQRVHDMMADGVTKKIKSGGGLPAENGARASCEGASVCTPGASHAPGEEDPVMYMIEYS